MNRQTYENNEITAYLLGFLPEAEAEHFDELSFTDNNFADTLKSAEKDLVDAYVQGELSGKTLEKFTSYYLASPIRCEKVKFAQAFKVYAEQNTTNFPKDSKPERTIFGFFSALNIFKNLNPLLQFGFAVAALVLIVLGGLWLVTNRLNQPKIEIEAKKEPTNQREKDLPNQPKETPAENTQPDKEIAAANTNKELPKQKPDKESTKKVQVVEPIVTPKPIKSPMPQQIGIAFILAPPLRDGSQTPSLSIPKQINFVAAKLQLEADDYPTYRVALVNQSNQTLWQSGKLKTQTRGKNKSLNLNIPAKLLKSQIYSLEVSGINPKGEAEIISNYPFRAVLK